MSTDIVKGRLAFLRAAEKLKNTIRTSWSSLGRPESTAEHTWRLCLMATVFADQMPNLDLAKLLKICVFHDLGEAVNGDIPATRQATLPQKSESERRDFESLLANLDDCLKKEFLEYWDDYENGTSAEGKAVKALDKLETILQHNQGMNPPAFDYLFNLQYGKKNTDALPFTKLVRSIIDDETKDQAKSRVIFRNEEAGDSERISSMAAKSFAGIWYSEGHEAAIVANLRQHGQLMLSMLAVDGENIIGHAAMSPVTIKLG